MNQSNIIYSPCRLCYLKHGSVKNTKCHDVFSKDENGVILNDLILEHTGIKIYEEDIKPKFVCTFCKKDVTEMDFQKNAEKNKISFESMGQESREACEAIVEEPLTEKDLQKQAEKNKISFESIGQESREACEAIVEEPLIEKDLQKQAEKNKISFESMGQESREACEAIVEEPLIEKDLQKQAEKNKISFESMGQESRETCEAIDEEPNNKTTTLTPPAKPKKRIPPYSCDQCIKICKTSAGLSSHIRSHNRQQ